jgi:hypothetical protein
LFASVFVSIEPHFSGYSISEAPIFVALPCKPAIFFVLQVVGNRMGRIHLHMKRTRFPVMTASSGRSLTRLSKRSEPAARDAKHHPSSALAICVRQLRSACPDPRRPCCRSLVLNLVLEFFAKWHRWQWCHPDRRRSAKQPVPLGVACKILGAMNDDNALKCSANARML